MNKPLPGQITGGLEVEKILISKQSTKLMPHQASPAITKPTHSQGHTDQSYH